MNEFLIRVANLYKKESRLIIGLMSGTSLDGLDIALCKISGSGLQTKAEILEFETLPYTDDFKEDVRTVFSRRQADLEKVTLLNAKIGTLHADQINLFLQKHHLSKNDIDCIASHGQTIYHAPKRQHQLADYPNGTLQIGDADHIAVRTGIITLSDFRQKHIAAGGEGAPLALYGDYILFSSDAENRVLLNIGGISNFSWLPRPASMKPVVCTDAGPGNTLIDALCKMYFHTSYDSNGDIARSGTVNERLLAKMLEHPFFMESLPKTTGPEVFNLSVIDQAFEKEELSKISKNDLLSTATQFTAVAAANAIKAVAEDEPFGLYVSGGGANNTFLMEKISEQLHTEARHMDELGIAGDAKEALLFALLANETICGSALQTNAGPQVTMGKISLPE